MGFMTKSLDEIRQKIDAIDDQILKLLNERATHSLTVKKTAGGTGALRRGREVAIVSRMVAANTGPFSDGAVRDIFESIVYNGRGIQVTLQVGYLGPAGTYSEQAAREMFGELVALVPKRSLTEVVAALERGETHIAVVPIENSSEGAVTAAHTLLRKTSKPIIAEHTMHIRHALLSKAQSTTKVKKIYGHPQALGQCRVWLETHMPNAELIACASNAQGLELAETPDSAAIAGVRNAIRYDMNVLETAINDETDNATRFIALGNDAVEATGDDKTSLVCTVHDHPGALYELLGVLNARGVSMTRLESQPDSAGRYAFFIDFVGHRDTPAVATMLDELAQKATSLQVFGSYPQEAA